MLMAVVTATLFLRTNLHPDSVASGNLYFSVIFFSLISLMFDGFAEETLTVSPMLIHVPWLTLFSRKIMKQSHLTAACSTELPSSVELITATNECSKAPQGLSPASIVQLLKAM